MCCGLRSSRFPLRLPTRHGAKEDGIRGKNKADLILHEAILRCALNDKTVRCWALEVGCWMSGAGRQFLRPDCYGMVTDALRTGEILSRPAASLDPLSPGSKIHVLRPDPMRLPGISIFSILIAPGACLKRKASRRWNPGFGTEGNEALYG